MKKLLKKGDCGHSKFLAYLDTEKELDTKNINITGIVSVLFNEDNKIVLTQHTDGGYDLIGGKTENGESIEDTMKREAIEEAGFEINNSQYFGYYEITLADNAPEEYKAKYPKIGYILFFISKGKKVSEPFGAEIKGCKSFSIEELEKSKILDHEMLWEAIILVKNQHVNFLKPRNKSLTRKSTAIVIFGVLISIISLGLYIWFTKTPIFKIFETWIQGNLILFYIFVVFSKVLAIIWPPLPGNLFTLASIPFWGWFIAYTADFIGSMIGSSLAFFIGKKYGYVFINKVFGDEIEYKVKSVKVKKGREVESVFILRAIGGGVIMEAVCYGAGLLNIKYKHFLVGSIFSHLVFGLPTFLLASQIFESKNIVVTAIVAILSLFIIYKVKGRYFE